MQQTIIYAGFALAGVALTALVTWLNAAKRVSAEHITKERAEWRRVVRKQALKVHDAILKGNIDEISKLKCQFQALLNPQDTEDLKIVCSIQAEDSGEDREKLIEVFTSRIAWLLKHDWERAKLEAGFFLKRWILKPNRMSTKPAACDTHLKPSSRYATYTIKPLPTACVLAALATVGVVALCSH